MAPAGPRTSDAALVAAYRAGDRHADRVAVREALLRVRPGGPATGSVRLDQPVRVLRRSGGWSRVSTDAGRKGWVPSSALRALPERTP